MSLRLLFPNELTIDEDLNFKDFGEAVKGENQNKKKSNPLEKRKNAGPPEANYTSHFAFFITKESKQKLKKAKPTKNQTQQGIVCVIHNLLFSRIDHRRTLEVFLANI